MESPANRSCVCLHAETRTRAPMGLPVPAFRLRTVLVLLSFWVSATWERGGEDGPRACEPPRQLGTRRRSGRDFPQPRSSRCLGNGLSKDSPLGNGCRYPGLRANRWYRGTQMKCSISGTTKSMTAPWIVEINAGRNMETPPEDGPLCGADRSFGEPHCW